MVTIEQILNHLTKLNLTYTGKFNIKSNIESIKILNLSDSLSTETLYISTSYEDTIKASTDYNLMLITKKEITHCNIPQLICNLSIEYIFYILSQFIFDNYKLSFQSNIIYNSFYDFNTLEEILNCAEQYLNNPIFLINPCYIVLCSSDKSKYIKQKSTEKHNEQYYLNFNIVNLMKKNKCLDNIYKSLNSFFYSDEDNLIFSPVKVNEITTSYICVLENDRKFKETDLKLVDVLSKVVAAFFEKENKFISGSGMSNEYYLMNLLSNKIDNIEYIKEQFKNINFKFKEYFSIVAIPFTQKSQNYKYNFEIKHLMYQGQTILKNSLAAYYKENIIFLISADNISIFTDSIKSSFLDFLKLNELKCGISFSFCDLYNINDFLLQALNSVKFASKLRHKGTIFNFEDYLNYYLISLVNSNEINTKISLQSLINPHIKILIDYDKNNNSELFKTLKSYIENTRNAQLTSKALNINRSTFFYRFHKIEQILKVNINEHIYKFELAINILKFIDV